MKGTWTWIGHTLKKLQGVSLDSPFSGILRGNETEEDPERSKEEMTKSGYTYM